MTVAENNSGIFVEIMTINDLYELIETFFDKCRLVEHIF